MAHRPGTSHVAGCLVVLAIALFLLTAVFPPLVDAYLPRNARFVGLRGEAVDFFFVAHVPVLAWLLPPFARGLARLTHRGHRALLGTSGFYVRFPMPRRVRFRDTLVRALSPFAIDLLVISEIEYFLGGTDVNAFARGLFTIPLLLLAGILTSLLPGPWLVDALDLRLVRPTKGEAIREAAVFEGLLGPIGALALIASFVTLAHTVGDSYDQGLVLLGLWAARMFPAILVAVSVYRIAVEPKVLPELVAWTSREGIEVAPSLQGVLEGLWPAPPPPTADEQAPADAERGPAPRSPPG